MNDKASAPPPFWQQLPRVFTYPLHADAIVKIIVFALVVAITTNAGFFAWLISRLVWLGNLLVIPASLVAITAMRDSRPHYQSPSVYQQVGGFNASDGRPVTNIYPYDADGRLLHGVLLYDQDGQPIEVFAQAQNQGISTEVVPDVNGAAILNAYPYDQRAVGYGDQGTSTPAGQPPAVVVPRQSTTTTTEALGPPTTLSGAG